MKEKLNLFLKISAISVIPTLLVWMPFFFRFKSFWGIPLPNEGMATVVANYDGPLFLVVGKTLYNKALIGQSFAFNLPGEYYAAHFPLFPVLIKLFATFFGFPYAMLFVTMLTSILACYFFYKLAEDMAGKADAMWLTFIFSIFPARWLIVRSVGSAEPLFVGSILASLYYFRNKKFFWAGVWGGIAQLTKSPGILLFIAYFMTIFIPNIKSLAVSKFLKIAPTMSEFKKIVPLMIIPLSLLCVFAYYGVRMNDFFAYFHSGDNIHLFFPPFQIFNFSAPWVGTFWLEEVIFVYLIALLGTLKVIRSGESVLSWFVVIFLAMIFMVSHRDIVRYALPIAPILILGFRETLVKRDFKFIMMVLLIPIYLFSLVYISQNVMPVADWRPLL